MVGDDGLPSILKQAMMHKNQTAVDDIIIFCLNQNCETQLQLFVGRSFVCPASVTSPLISTI